MTSRWPEYRADLAFPEEEAAMEAVMDTIKAIRARRAEMNVPPSRKAEVLIVTATPDVYAQGRHFIQRLAYASEVKFADAAPTYVSGMVTAVTHNATAYLPLSELVDIAAELERIRKEIEKAQNGLRGVEQKLSNEKLVSRVPGGGGERRAGEGRQVQRADRQAGGIRQGHAGVSPGRRRTYPPRSKTECRGGGQSPDQRPDRRPLQSGAAVICG